MLDARKAQKNSSQAVMSSHNDASGTNSEAADNLTNNLGTKPLTFDYHQQ